MKCERRWLMGLLLLALVACGDDDSGNAALDGDVARDSNVARDANAAHDANAAVDLRTDDAVPDARIVDASVRDMQEEAGADAGADLALDGVSVDASPIGGTAEEDFAARCALGDVIFCDGFDDQRQVNANWAVQMGSGPRSGMWERHGNPSPAPYPANVVPESGAHPGLYYPAVDTTGTDLGEGGRVSGDGVLRIIANAGESDTQIGGLMDFGNWNRASGAPGPDWRRRVPAGPSDTETLYIQLRQQYTPALADYEWGIINGGSPKMFVVGADPTCAVLESFFAPVYREGAVGVNAACGGEGLFWNPTGGTAGALGTNYAPMAGHVQFLYQAGPFGPSDPRARTRNDDFACMRNFGNDETCLRTPGTGGRWWTHYCALTLTPPGEGGDQYRCWVYRSGVDPYFRQWVDSSAGGASSGFNKRQITGAGDRNDECCFENFMFKIQPNDSDPMPNLTGRVPDQSIFYDELILSADPIPVPVDDGHGDAIPVGPHTVECPDGRSYVGFCPGELP
ncbi:MAG: hypothetical protein AAF411_11960 [Myxococcota bacterium]